MKDLEVESSKCCGHEETNEPILRHIAFFVVNLGQWNMTSKNLDQH